MPFETKAVLKEYVAIVNGAKVDGVLIYILQSPQKKTSSLKVNTNSFKFYEFLDF